MQQPARVTQVPVREERQEIAGRLAAQHAPPQDDEPRVLEHPHLAPVLGLVRRRRRLEGERFRLVDRAPPALHHEVGKRKVVPEARIDLDVVRPAERVDRAVAGRDRAEPRLGLAGHELIAPVDALLVPPAWRLEPRLTAHIRDSPVCEVADKLPERVGSPGRVRVGEGDDFRVRRTHRSVLRCDFPAARIPDHPGTRRPRELLGAVGGRIRRDKELEQLARIVERAKVREPPLDRALLVVGGDDHRDRREIAVVEGDAPGTDARGEHDSERGRAHASTRARLASPRRGRRPRSRPQR